MGKLSGKVAIVTGAAGGVGLVIGELFLEEGAKVVFTDVRTPTPDHIEPAENIALFLRHDVSSGRQWEETVEIAEERFGPVDILVNNAGIAQADRSIEECTEEEYRC